MGTNFYLRPHGSITDNTNEMIHLGKRSMGWTFLFRAYPEPITVTDRISLKVADYASWRELISYGTIVDEYGRELTSVEMQDNISTLQRIATHGRTDWARSNVLQGEFFDEDGNRFSPYEFC